MTYEETIEYLYRQLPMFSRIGVAAYKKDLHNTISLCHFLGDPQHKFRSIHIAGTNGKGSTSHMLAAILQEAGYKTGLYTSPHIKDFTERIRVNGQMIKKDFVVSFTEKTKIICEEIKPSFFELTVAMAFEYFATEKVDIAVIETGLGGRLDSTNVISPVLSVITNIGYDHMNILGNTLPEIASEKAGIIKKNTPVVIGKELPETVPVFAGKAVEMNAALFFADDMYSIIETNRTGSNLSIQVYDKSTDRISTIETDLAGTYQAENVCTVLLAVDQLRNLKFAIPDAAIQTGLKNVKGITGLHGRWEILQKDPSVIVDVAHNEDGIKQVLKQLETDYPNSILHFVIGFVNDKDVSKVLSLFPSTARYYFTNAHIPRALPFQALQENAKQFGLKGEGFDNVNDAINAALLNAGKKDVVMVCGSFFIIAEIEETGIVSV